MQTQPFGMQELTMGGGEVQSVAGGQVRMRIPAAPSAYTNAQLDDHRGLPRRDFPSRPPIRMRLQAQVSLAHPLGTLGFGFWNDPFSLTFGQAGAARKLPVPPQAAWFFHASKPNDMALAPPNPGWGWKAQVITSPAIPGWALAAPAAAAYLAAQVPFLRGPVMRLALARLECAERCLESQLDTWHTYELVWQAEGVTLVVDGAVVLETSVSPPGPLGFVTWIDNQYAIASPAGGLRFGVIPTDFPQTLELRGLEITQLSE